MTSSGASSDRVYDELSTPAEMREDARVVVTRLRLDEITVAAGRGAPSLRYEDYPREVAKPEVSVSRAAARLAASLHLHLD
jgi:hypothetical protein